MNTIEKKSLSDVYPCLNQFVEDKWGIVELGKDLNHPSLVRIRNSAGMLWESDTKTLGASLAAAEAFLADWLENLS